MRNSRVLVLVAGALLFLLGSCSTTRYLQEDQYLLDQNKVLLKGYSHHISKDDLQSLIRQKPNRRLLGTFRFGNWVYFKSTQGKETKFKQWMSRTMAKEPVILDTVLAASSLRQMELYLRNKGSFDNVVSYEVRYGRHNARVRYHLNPSEPYLIRNIQLVIPDTTLSYFVHARKEQSLLRPGDYFDVDVFDNERDRIVRELKEVGYYAFTKEYISFLVDSTSGQRQMDVTMSIAPPLSADTGALPLPHPRYRLRRVYVHPDFNPLLPDSVPSDTTVVAEKRWILDKPAGLFYFIHHGQPRVNHDVILQGIYLDPGMFFRLSSGQLTYRRLSDLPLYRFVNIQFREIPPGYSLYERELDAEIRMTRAPVQAYSIETEGTNSAGDLGIAGSLLYTNRNLFRGAETFDIRIKGALEMQQIAGPSEREFLVFNTFETGAEVGLRFPRFLAPISSRQFPKIFEPKTRIDLGVNLRQRPQYQRLVTNVSFGYEWKESETRRHILYPADINSVKIMADSSFNPGIYGPLYASQYSDHLTTALKYSFIFNNQQVRKGLDFIYFRGNFSASGNLLNFVEGLAGMDTEAGGYRRLFGIRYAQYLRTDIDFRYYRVLSPHQNLVYRMAAGVGLPYGNSDVLPFEQAFFSGGANSLRGWEVRSLGPGGFRDLAGGRYDKVGDVLLEMNVEYRFPVYRYLKAALFADAGNVWLLQPNAAFPDGHFILNSFPEQIAVDGGIGIRLDFGFFLFRVDAALPLRRPESLPDERWQKPASWRMKDVAWNFGIGHPF